LRDEAARGIRLADLDGREPRVANVLRMEQVRQLAHAVCDPRRRSREVRIGVDGDWSPRFIRFAFDCGDPLAAVVIQRSERG